MDDLISRQAAIDAIKDRYYKYGRFAKIEELVWSIEQLPPAQPEQHIDEWCTDCKEYDLVFARMGCNAQFPYNGKYQGQKGATGSKILEDFIN